MEKGKAIYKNKRFIDYLTSYSGVSLLALISGALSIAGGTLAVVGNWYIITFNPSSISKLAHILSSNSSNITNVINFLNLVSEGAMALKYGLLFLAPLMLIAGVLMILAGFYYGKKTKHSVFLGMLINVIVNSSVLIAFLLYIRLSPVDASVLISYLGAVSISSGAAVSLGVFSLLTAYAILAMLSTINAAMRLLFKE